jgi:hypothetical protein
MQLQSREPLALDVAAGDRRWLSDRGLMANLVVGAGAIVFALLTYVLLVFLFRVGPASEPEAAAS